FRRCNFVFWLRHTHQPMIKPADDTLQSLDPMPRLAGAGKLMRLVRETHHHCWNFAELQSAKHLLAPCAGRCAIVCFAENKHHGCLYVSDVTDRRARAILIWIFEWRRSKPVRLEKREVARLPPAFPAGDIPLRDGRINAPRFF